MNLTIGEAILKTAKYFSGLGMDSARLEAELLLAFVLGCQRVKLYQDWDCPLETHEVNGYREVMLQRARGVPMAYITGVKSFLSWDFKLSPAVLIPRPETELLVELGLRAIDALNIPTQEIACADLGTGSGILAISLAKLRPGLRVDAYDLSPEALAIAGQNVNALGVSEMVRLIEGDFGTATMENAPDGGYHLIVSNPPYIPTYDLEGLAKEVQKEPRLALDGGRDGLDAYRSILQSLPKALREAGDLIMEHGYDQASQLKELLGTTRFGSIEDYPDLAGTPRVIWGHSYNKVVR